MKRALFLFLISSLCWAGTHKLEVLPLSKIEKMKQGPCTLIHVWATWCTICIQEMPNVIAFLSKEKKLRPVIIDVSAPMVQDNFSKQFMRNQKPTFTTYLKPKGKDEEYLFAIDKFWSGALPYTALYTQGKQKKVWVGELNLEDVKKTFTAACR